MCVCTTGEAEVGSQLQIEVPSRMFAPLVHPQWVIDCATSTDKFTYFYTMSEIRQIPRARPGQLWLPPKSAVTSWPEACVLFLRGSQSRIKCVAIRGWFSRSLCP